MRRFLIFAATLFLLFIGASYLLYYQGAYLPVVSTSEIAVPFRTLEKDIQRLDESGNYITLTLEGVDVSASQPGSHTSDFDTKASDYLRWFDDIAQMGANTIRVHTLMDDDFYNAFYAHNTTRESPLYLLQGIQVSDAANHGSQDAYHESFMGSLISDGQAAVDIIHGRRMLSQDRIPGGAQYKNDVSPWVIGYLVGHDWVADTIAYTDHSVIHDGVYAGTYFTTSADATAFEAMLAEVMDSILTYEASKYQTQRIIGFTSAPDIDFLIFEDVSARQYDKYAQLNAEHVLPTPALSSGFFAAYRLFDYCADFINHISAAQREELAPLLSQIDPTGMYGGYLQLLSRYHTMPVVAAGYGFSSARGTVSAEQEPLTESEQGFALMRVWQEAAAEDWAGVCISSWQDHWDRRTWNTTFATELTNSYLWHDLQSDGQNYGLLAFTPAEESVCMLDGQSDEWTDTQPFYDDGTLSIRARFDRSGLYLLLCGETVSPATALYLPIDMTPETGSTCSETPALSFDRAADFILCIDGTENTRLLVQERYDAMRENFYWEIARRDPFIQDPDPDSAEFTVASMAVANSIPADALLNKTLSELRDILTLSAYETGYLTHGVGDPASRAYHSLADFCFGDQCMEIRLPWLLLNVADPADMQIHKDYYTCYGVEFEKISACWIGVGDGEQTIPLSMLELPRMGRIFDWQERLKQSYYIVQQHWGQTP